MKKLTILSGVLLCFFLSIDKTYAQDSLHLEARAKQRLLLNQFESEMVLSASERIAKKQSRLAHQYHLKSILDTLNISNMKRNNLLKELKKDPFSERVQAFIDRKTKSKDSIE